MIALIHIKKTAGKSLKHIMRCAFGVAHCDVKRWQPQDECFGAEDLRRLRRIHPGLVSIAGHSIRSHSDLQTAEPALRYYTFMRDPIKRCISEYQYSVHQGRCAPDSFAEWIQRPVFRNVQTRSLAGCDDAARAIRELDERIAFVGLMERFDESLAMMQPLLNLPRFTPLQRRVNAASDHRIRDAVLADPQAMAEVAAANEADSAVFEYVQRELYPRQQRLAGRTQVAVSAADRPRQFNARFFANGAYRYLVYKPAVSAYRLMAG
ncbi:sulfotransferase family 2 domain-containing protein [Salinisphaera sp. T31B1]|uniref:sulfotransferase family 2 domain-containing protein n=1 Tax=Salinisphaera sp. T31B1 TaxID=727963 RepID=UPI00333F88F5